MQARCLRHKNAGRMPAVQDHACIFQCKRAPASVVGHLRLWTFGPKSGVRVMVQERRLLLDRPSCAQRLTGGTAPKNPRRRFAEAYPPINRGRMGGETTRTHDEGVCLTSLRAGRSRYLDGACPERSRRARYDTGAPTGSSEEQRHGARLRGGRNRFGAR